MKNKKQLFDYVNIEDLINENTNFYINESKEMVVVFQKYKVAVGAAGKIEFSMIKIK